jgi:3-deoxy-manno-octulosonate cytidylyltransferase (CMP-KDO synthetase)
MRPMPKVAIIVPCRLESTRFPRKLLHQIKGRPLLAWVVARLQQEAPEIPLYFAVDHALLRDCVIAAGGRAIMTDPAHNSGTDRIAEANRTVQAEQVINVQADEPLVSAAQIRALAELIVGDAPMATLATPFTTAVDFLNPNQVKVVLASTFAKAMADKSEGRPTTHRALFFSRSPLPYARDRHGAVDDAWVRANPCYRHLGLYAYQADLLEKFTKLPPGRLEQIEKLEQLRVLENGYEIACGLTTDPTIGVDTPEDAEKFERYLG